MEKKIYVLHRDEFFDNNLTLSTTLTYFKVDDILVDDRGSSCL